MINTRTRDITPVDAAGAIRAWLNSNSQPAPNVWSKRIDSALRGPIVAELAALIGEVKTPRGVFAPATPAAGRTTENGHHYVDHSWVADLRTIVGQIADGLPISVGGDAPPADGWWIPDIRTVDDFARVAAALPVEDDGFMIVDSGGLTAATCARMTASSPIELNPERTDGNDELLDPNRERILVVQGSRSDVVQSQVDFLRGAAIEKVHILHREVTGRHDPVLHELAVAGARHLQEGDVGLLVTGGGLTAEALLDRAEIREGDLEPLASPGPMVGLARVWSGDHLGLVIATKGGMIGTRSTLVDLIATLRRGAR